ncbi:MAG TPA: helix-turn-helix transcriptional regulator [Gammaproteobacteria bacterium]|nr:helix-turn-helix transcriptional regulator [Gammaproteobacteria bacterium]
MNASPCPSLHDLFSDSPMTVSAWIRRQRLERCREVLREPHAQGMSVTEIALACGFKDPAHFCKAYRRHFGIAPTAARNKPD